MGSPEPFRYRWFVPGDGNAFFSLLLDNMINLVVLASLLTGVFGFPADIIYTRMVPGTALGVLVGDLIYTWLAFRLARKLQRQDITAMPLGLDTPSTIGMALAVLGPAFVALRSDLLASGASAADAARDAAMGAWAIGMAAMLVMGVVKLAFSFVGDWVRRHIPTAGLLGSIGGIGLAMLAFLPLIEIFQAPVVGLVTLGLVLYALVARIPLPGNLPGAAVAVLLGVVLYYVLGPLGLLGGAEFRTPSPELNLAWPVPTLSGLSALNAALPYLPIAIPFGVLTIVGGINVTESAHAAGDPYETRSILLTEALATIVAGFCGGVAQSTPYIGHPAYKEMGARAGYTLATGVVVGLGGVLGYVSFVTDALPLVAVMPLLIFIGLEITTQAFEATPRRHGAAVAFSFLPILAYLVLIRQDALLGGIQGGIAAASAQLGAQADLVNGIVNGVIQQTQAPIIVGLGHGFILTAMLWGSFFACIIDRAFLKAALYIGIAGTLTLFGAIHSAAPTGALYWPWRAPSALVLHWAAGYFALAFLIAILSLTQGARTSREESRV
jgi:AGZA family xanthine/uracil permease-like MFS transporter